MAQFGDIDACTIMRDPSGRSRGFAFLTYTSPASVTKVMAQTHHLDGKQVGIHVLSGPSSKPKTRSRECVVV